MAVTRLGRLLQLLQRRTEEGKIVWEATVDEYSYQAAFPNYTVQIGSKQVEAGWDEKTIYFLKILDEDAKLMEEVTNNDLGSEIEDSYEVMERLYRSARRRAMGVDKALDNILSELENNN